MNEIRYETNTEVSLEDFRSLLQRSTLGERRPLEDQECLGGMLANSNLLVTAWVGDLLIGIARAMTDFHYACYLSDLAIDESFQRQGIGKELLRLATGELGPSCKLILVSAPAANDYYPALGFESSSRCWVLPAGRKIE